MKLLLILVGLCLVSCQASSSSEDIGPWPTYDLADASSFYDHPYPSDIRYPPGQPQDFSGFPNPADTSQIQIMKEMIAEERSGAGLTAGLVLHFAEAVDLSSWPATPENTIEPDSPIHLIELTREGTPSGELIPVRWHYSSASGTYHPENTLRIVPDTGFSLRPNSTYAFVIQAGAGVTRSPHMEYLLSGHIPDAPLGQTASTIISQALSSLKSLNYKTDQLVYLQVFTTDDPAASLKRVFDDALSRQATYHLDNVTQTRDEPEFCLLEGTVSLPQFQQPDIEFNLGGGALVFDAQRRLVQQGSEDVPFSVAVPKKMMPSTGWPLVIFIHGTAGHSTQHIDRGASPPPSSDQAALQAGHLTTKNRGPGYVLTRRGIATAGSALPVNPQRVPSVLGWGFYNFFQPRSVQDNFRQGVFEQAMFLRAMTQARLDPSLCPGADVSASSDQKIQFSGNRVGAMGQSLGAIELGLLAPVEPLLGAVVPSGAGGLYAIMITTSTIIPGDLMLRIFGEMNSNEDPTLLHPVGLLLQMAFESVDPVALAYRLTSSPLEGVPAKHSYYPAGYIDGFFWPASIRALMGPSGVEQAGDIVEATLPDILERQGHSFAAYPVKNNVSSPDGPRTAVVVQYPEDGILDGHHVSYQLDGPKHQYGCFFQSYFETGIPVVPEPVTTFAPCP